MILTFSATLRLVYMKDVCLLMCFYQSRMNVYTVEPVYIEHSREMKKCSMYAGVQCIQVLNVWRSGEI